MTKAKRISQAEFNTLISRTRSVLTLEHPFFGVLSFGMDHILDDTIDPPTACVNGMTVRYHPEFVASLTKDEMLFLVAHECMHPMLDHIGRLKGREPRRWNIACDIVVNHYLQSDGIGRMPRDGVVDADLYAKAGGVVEAIYDLLPSDEQDGDDGDDGDGGSDPGNPSGPSGSGRQPTKHKQMDAMEEGDTSTAELDSKWKPLLTQARNAAKAAGKLSGLVQRLVDQAVVTPPDWRTLMADWMTRVTMGDQRTWSRPSRRMAAAGMYRPSTYDQVVGEVVIAVDCSGSVSPDMLNMFMAHVTALCGEVMPKRIHMMYFHDTVFRVDTYDSAEDIVIDIRESGGTAFAPIFKRIDDMGIEPVCCVVLTDLYCDIYGQQPDYPVLWASTTDTTAKWGRTIRIK